MTFRLGFPSDRPTLTALWQEAFGDTKETVDLFFNTCYKAENTLVCAVDGQIAAALYLLESTLQTEAGSFSAAYIYAAATKSAHRKQGLMTELLRFSLEVAQARGWDYLYLVPASDDLYRYYGARGFETAFYKREIQLSRAQLLRLAAKSATPLPDTPKKRLDVRDSALKDVPHVVWSESALEFAKMLETAFDIHCALSQNGFAVWEQEGTRALVTEFCCRTESLPETAALLLAHSTAKAFTLHTPAELFPAEGKLIPSGMLKAITQRAKVQTEKNLYLGMTLG